MNVYLLHREYGPSDEGVWRGYVLGVYQNGQRAKNAAQGIQNDWIPAALLQWEQSGEDELTAPGPFETRYRVQKTPVQ